MRKESQAALEFITTYAWIFIVITITIGTLYSSGIFDFGKYLPQKCVFPSQFECLDFGLKPTEVRIKLVNNLGEDICVKSMQITNDATPPISCTFAPQPQGSCAASEFQWVHAVERDLFFTNCAGGAYIPDERIELRISMSYYAINTPSMPIHLINGKINGQITSS